MSGRRNRKKGIDRIDVDWLLGESAHPSVRDFSWFRRVIVSLICILAVVWSWPYASKWWLNWELQQQLASPAGKPSDDVLTILLALNELNPNRSDAVVPTGPASKSPVAATQFRITDNGSTTASPLDPPSLRQMRSSRQDAERTAMESGPVLTSMRTLIDQAETTTVSQLPNLNISIPRTISKAMVVPTPAVTLEPVAPMDPRSASATNFAQDSNVIRGFEKRPLEELLPFLASSQSRFVQQASSELLGRGMTPSQLEIAIALAQGDIEQRLKAMETIVRDPKLNAIPWLVWMAESADRSVRRRAIVLLGSMTDPDARRKLRILQCREPDSAIADQISQVLLASGTASISVR